jgi:Ca-activated chloride channel family protein
MKKQYLFRIAGILAIFLLTRLAATTEDIQKSNVVIILDASGSMKSNLRSSRTQKMAAAKHALKEVLKTVPQDTQIGLLVFSGTNVKNHWVYPLGPRNDARLNTAIDMIEPGGGTPLGAYIKIGADRLVQERKNQMGYGQYRLLIVTDGQAQDIQLVNTYTPEVLSRGVIMDVIGVDMVQNHTLATKVHSYRKADDPESLKKAVAEVFAEVSEKGTDAISSDAFEIIKPLPDEVADKLLKALVETDNSPIGGKELRKK